MGSNVNVNTEHGEHVENKAELRDAYSFECKNEKVPHFGPNVSSMLGVCHHLLRVDEGIHA